MGTRTNFEYFVGRLIFLKSIKIQIFFVYLKYQKMVKYKNVKVIDCDDWDALVEDTYKKPYTFQQQYDCQSRGMFSLKIPCDNWEEEEMHESIPEEVNGEKMGVKFDVWLERDPKQPIPNQKYDYQLEMFWERNFYPSVYTVANDLYKKGLIEAGDYSIKIDW